MSDRDAKIAENLVIFGKFVAHSLPGLLIGLILFALVISFSWNNGCTLLQQIPHLLESGSLASKGAC